MEARGSKIRSTHSTREITYLHHVLGIEFHMVCQTPVPIRDESTTVDGN